MNRLLLLALPTVLLAACTQPRETGDAPAAPTEAPTAAATADAGAPAAPAAPAATATPAKADGFTEVAVIRAAATLPRHQWRLATATDAAGASIGGLLARADKPVTLEFKGGQLAVGNTCNAMSSSYTMAGKHVTVARLDATRKACADPALAALDPEVASRLSGPLAIRLSKAEPVRLELTNAAGDVLVFGGAAAAR